MEQVKTVLHPVNDNRGPRWYRTIPRSGCVACGAEEPWSWLRFILSLVPMQTMVLSSGIWRGSTVTQEDPWPVVWRTAASGVLISVIGVEMLWLSIGTTGSVHRYYRICITAHPVPFLMHCLKIFVLVCGRSKHKNLFLSDKHTHTIAWPGLICSKTQAAQS